MDSLFCKIGSLRALVPASARGPCEGPCHTSQSAQAPLRSVQVCTCKSPSSPPFIAPAKTKPARPAEESTSKNGALASSFNPFPLLLSYSAIPAPLNFLWFTRKGEEATEPRDQDPWESACGAGEGEESILLNYVEKDNEGKDEEALNESKAEVYGFMANEETVDESMLDVNGLITKEDTLNDVKVEDAASFLSFESPAVIHNLVDTSTPVSREKSWFLKIADIKAFWPDPKFFKKQSTSTHAPSPEPKSDPVSSSSIGIEACSETHHALQSSEGHEGNDVACKLDAGLSCSLEVPYTRVLHTKETFSRFLQDASLYDLKGFAQMAFLCDMAYMIPGIQPGQLMKYHHLKLVTSSLDKKAEAESKAKEDESLKKSSTSGAGKLSEASHANTVQSGPSTAPDVSCLSDEDRRASSISQIDLRHILSSLEGNKSTDKDSLMAVAPATVVTLAEEETKMAVAKDLRASRSCPCEWFVCDEPSTNTRVFVIQGSESLASWQANLFFEPTKFEGLDVSVHRGIYEAAIALYDEVLPEVLAHFSTHGDLAQVRFTGHSLGGSLATLLALMFQIRGVLPSTAILPVVTFGSPCIMCGGDHLLQNLKLPKNHIQSVIMHRDVVPRAFACDYPDHVTEVLKRLNGRFRDHPCLDNQKLLYAPMGQILILQPDENAAPCHPLLPDGHGLYVLRHPMNGGDVKNATELRAAQRAFLNIPHPLDLLGDPGAYGFDGAVSRDHDPRSYTKAIHVVLKHEVKRLRRVQREQRRQLWWPLVIAQSSFQKGIRSGGNLDQSRGIGALTSTVSSRKQTVNYAAINHIGFSMRDRSILGSHNTDTFSRYTRFIASQHVQIGMLLALSLRVVVLECTSTLFACI